jgi:hypothetical protein
MNMNFNILKVVCICILFGSPVAAKATPVLPSVAGYIEQFGTQYTLHPGPDINAANFSSFPPPIIDQGIVEYSLASVTEPLSAVTLHLWKMGCGGIASCSSTTQVELYGYAGDGVLSLSDWSAGTLITILNIPAGTGSLVTTDVLNFVNGLPAGSGFAGFNLRMVSADASDNFSSSLAALDVVTVPVPATIYLFGSGLLALAGVMKKHKMN